MFDPDDDPTRNNVTWFLIRDFLRTIFLVIRVSWLLLFRETEKLYYRTLYFSLIIINSLQLRGCK